MRDIKQYFVNGRDIVDEKVDSGNDVEREDQEETIATGKRKRVKIRISRDSSASRMCDIIESRSDLIDKTPSPFNSEINSDHKALQDGTPKSGSTESDVKRRPKKHSKFAVKMDENQSEETRNILQEKELNEQIVADTNNSPDNSIINFNDETVKSDIEFHNEIGSQREESNAFQVLMSRSKPIQYKLPPIEDIESKEKSDYAKELRSKCKEKLITMADKKGYSKRKITEMEESEKIEKNIQNRMRFFKGESKNNIQKKDNSFEVSIKNTKQSGNLLNYFSKSPSELTNKDDRCTSTFIVKADVHRSDNSEIEPVKPISEKRYSNKKSPKSELDLSTVNDIHIIESENFSPYAIKQDQQKREKPRWSLRIKLHSSEDNDSLNDTDDELFSPRSKSKFNASNKPRNFLNIENNEMYLKDCDQNLKKMQDKEKKESIIKHNISNIVKDASINDSNGDTDLKKSNENNRKEQKINDTNEMIITINDDFNECEIIDENVLKRKPNEKLAPLFVKRRKTDPAVTTARRLFLQSDIIDVENKNTDRKVNYGTSMLPFPSISHITQLKNNSDSIRSEIKHKFSMKIEKKYSPTIDISNYKYIINCSEASTKTINEPVRESVERVLLEIEKLYPDVQKMWKTISTIKNDSEKKPLSRRIRKTRALERKRTLTENVRNEESRTDNCAWIYKYKPMSAQEVVGNEQAADKLKDWLSSWRMSLTKENDYSSGDEFYSSDCSSSCNNENNQVAVLLGPHGSGKTASVYAIAEELGYSVLEVNASSRRTGKRILKELEEATKSHRIKKSKHKSPFERITNENETSKISQNSLIFLEDIDLVFDEDEGFISAAYQLASNTKRPIVMTCRDTCPHLNKMAPQQNKIYFHKVSGNRVSALLELISLAETSYRIPHNYLMKLLQAGDLRQALLQLQYLLLSGPPMLSEQSTIMKPSLWQDMQSYLYKPAIKLNKRHRSKKSAKNNILNNLAEDLDSLSLVSCLIDVADTTLDISEDNAQPNLSLAENVSFYSAVRDLNADIANFINSQILSKNLEANEHVQNQSKIILRKQLNREIDLALSHVTSVCLDRQIMALDYLPTVRTICRTEESRLNANYKRGNRFFHYLNSLKVPAVSMKPNILAAACRMLQEKRNNTATTCTVNISN